MCVCLGICVSAEVVMVGVWAVVETVVVEVVVVVEVRDQSPSESCSNYRFMFN